MNKSANNKTPKNSEELSLRQRILRIGLLTVGGICLFLAQSTMWINHVIFDQQTFTNVTTEVILSQSSRDAIAQSIVDKTFENRPVADRLVGDRATNFVSSLLGSDISERALTQLASRSYGYITSPDRQDIAIELSAIRDPLAGIISFAESRGRDVKFDASAIPEQIVLVNSEDLPDVASYIRILLVAGAILWLTVFGTFLGYIFISKKDRVRRIYVVGGVISLVAILALFTGPFVPPAISSYVSNINLRGVVSDLTSAYLAPFMRQMYITLFLTAITLLIVRFRWIFTQAWDSTYKSINKKLSKHNK